MTTSSKSTLVFRERPVRDSWAGLSCQRPSGERKERATSSGKVTRSRSTSQDQPGAGILCEALLGAEPVAFVVPRIGKWLELVLVLACVMRAEEELAAAHRHADICLCSATVTAIERCAKPVLAAIHGYCLGGAIDLIAACDMRYSTLDAQFSIKEIDIGMAADVGTLQRMPHLISDGMLRELAFTGRTFDGEEARNMGLVNRTYADHEALLEGVFQLAREIAAKSPVAVRGTKEMLRYMRDHRIDDGLEYIATWNAAMLQSADLRIAIAAHMSKQRAEFAN